MFFFPIITYQQFQSDGIRNDYKTEIAYPLTDHMRDEIWLGYTQRNKCEALGDKIRPLGYVFFGGAHYDISCYKAWGHMPTPVVGSFPAPMPANKYHQYALNDSDDDNDNADGASSMSEFSLIPDDAYGNRSTGTAMGSSNEMYE